MIEAIVASILNKCLGKYIQDLDSENINLGIFNGNVELTDLKLRPEALIDLDLPIEVKEGHVGKILIQIPWTGLYSQPVIIQLEDLFALAGPIVDCTFDEQREKQLQRAVKQQKLEALENINGISLGQEEIERSFFEKLSATVLNNIQVFIRNIHIRYEDVITSPDCPFACGIAIHGLSAETTTNKWKSAQIDANATTVYKLIKLESFSVYWNPFCNSQNLTRNHVSSTNWKNIMKDGLATFSINEEEFDFIIKPISAKVKVIMNKSNEVNVPKLLLDFVLQDVASQLSRQQYLGIIRLMESFQFMAINRRYRKYHPNLPLIGNSKKWWKYAYTSVIEESIRPYSWERIKQHRERYYKYVKLYKERLKKPNDSEIKVDLQQLEDHFDLVSIIIGRQQARLQFAEEEPQKIESKKSSFKWWWPWFEEETENNDNFNNFEIAGERDRTVWQQLSADDKKIIYDAIGFAEGEKSAEKSKQYIEHKLNFTFANCILSLLNYDKEILVITLTQLLLSLETKPAAHAFHFSARTESFIVEGASIEHDLVPIITADHKTNVPHVFAVDLEKNPLHVSADYGISLQSEAVEIVYHEHSISEVIAFLQVPTANFEDMKAIASAQISKIVDVSRAAVEYAIENHKKVYVNVEMKSPYFIIPEHGTSQKGGSIIIADFGRLIMKTDLQTDEHLLEDATRTELEERLYDRFHITFSEVQVLFADSGDEWRVARTLPESDSSLIPKFQVQLIFSNSIKPDYRQLPRRKLNMTIPTIKLNLSDRRVRMLAEFCANLPMPKAKGYTLLDIDYVDGSEIIQKKPEKLNLMETIIEPDTAQLWQIQNSLYRKSNEKVTNNRQSRSSTDASQSGPEAYYSASDHSDEEPEEWAHMVDMPGFDDNISPSNVIVTLLRFCIGEVVVQLARSSDHTDKPYLMLRIDKLCADIALMEYGPAVQASLGGIQLVDKLHTGTSGEYLELLCSSSKTDIITILYRKVRSDCPEFKTYFHNVEQSLVIDFTTVNFTFHRGAFLTLSKFLEYISQRISGKDLPMLPSLPVSNDPTQLLTDEHDPPVPPGATKVSISVRLDEVKIKLCDSDLDFAEIKVAGLESDFILKANEKMIMRAQLSALTVDDLSDMTLYTKVLYIDDDRLFDFKYVRHSITHHKHQEIEDSKTSVNDDGTFRLRIGRVHAVLLYKFITNLQRFLDPFIHPHTASNTIRTVEKELHQRVEEMRNQSVKIHVSIDVNAPTLLIPQKSDSPNVLVFNLGRLTIENFFHETTASSNGSKHIVDNLLIRLNSVQMSRAVIALSGSLEIQEPILEPLKLRIDIKRALAPYHPDILLYDIHGDLDVVKLNLGQRDVGLLLAIYKENVSEGYLSGPHPAPHLASPMESVTPTTVADDTMVRNLQAFLTTSVHIRKEMNVDFKLEGMQIILYMDVDEILSSPVRDPSHELTKFEMDEVTLSYDLYNDKSIHFKCALQAISLQDIRSDSNLAIRKIFQSYSGASKVDMGMISVSMPPMVDVAYKQSPHGDASVDILIEKTRLNVSVPYILAIMKFIYDALPSEDSLSGGIVNPGFTGELTSQRILVGSGIKPRRPSSSDVTSGYQSNSSSTPETLPALTISAKLKKPEIIFFADPSDQNSRVLVVKADVVFDYNRNMGQENILATVAGLQILSCIYGKRKQTAYMVLHPCHVEFSQHLKSAEEGLIIKTIISAIDLRLSSSTVHTVTEIIEELTSSIKSDDNEGELIDIMDNRDLQDLWSPRSLHVSSYDWMARSDEDDSYTKACYNRDKPLEKGKLSIPSVKIVFELEDGHERIPVILLNTSLESEINNWSKQMYLTAELKLDISHYNEKLSVWEPLLEPVMSKENVYHPWELLIKVFRHRSQPIAFRNDDDSWVIPDAVCGDLHSLKSLGFSDSESSGDDTGSENGMVIIKKVGPSRSRHVYAQKSCDSGSLVGYPVDSDSENEEGILDKIASAFGHMFSSESSEGEPSESEEETGQDTKSDVEDETDTAEPELSVASEEERPIFLTKEGDPDGDDSVDSGVDEGIENTALYMAIDSRDKLEITLTPHAMNTIKEVIDAFTVKKPSGHNRVCQSCEGSLELINKLGPQAKINIIEKSDRGLGDEDRIVTVATIEDPDPASPASTALLVDITPPDSDEELEMEEVDRFSISSALSNVGSTAINLETVTCIEDDIAALYQVTTKYRINVEIEGFTKFQCLMPTKEETHLYALSPQKNDTRYHMVIDMAVHHRKKTVTVRSPLRIWNHTKHPISIYYQKTSLEGLGLPHPVQPKNPFEENICLVSLAENEEYDIPLFVAYHCKLFLQPTYMNYKISSSGIWWQDISTVHTQGYNINCPSDSETSGFSVKATYEEDSKLKLPSMGGRLIPNYILHLYPPVIIHNQLPYEVELKFKNFEQNLKLNLGCEEAIHNISLNETHQIKIEVLNYLGIPWTGLMELSMDMDDHKSVTMVTEYDTGGGNKQLGLSLHVDRTCNLDVYLYAPYWIVNKTGLPLQFRGAGSDIVYETQAGEEPLLFRFKRHRRKKAKVRVYNSKWSTSFSVDTVGSQGVIICKDKERDKKYQFLLSISLSHLQLTKIITVMPYFMVLNNTKRHLRYMEENEKTDLWLDIAPAQCAAFWPDTSSMKMFVKYRDSNVVSQHFPIDYQHSVTLRMDNGSALTVDVHGGVESPRKIVFLPYTQGDAPVRVDNLCEDLFLKIHQKSLGQVVLLSPYQSLLYTWDDPTIERTLFWNVYNRNRPGIPTFFGKDGYGQEKISFHTLKPSPNRKRSSVGHESSSDDDDSENEDPKRTTLPKETRKDKVIVHWVSYLEGHQRVLLFTEDERIAKQARKAVDAEKSGFELFVSIHNIGLSLVNNSYQEVAYLSIVSSPAIWQVEIKHRWKILPVELSSWLEDKWKADKPRADLKDYIQVDFKKMHMTKPFFGALRRIYKPGLWCQYRRSDHQSYFLFRVHRIQLDNQLPDAVFPTVLYPIPMPSYIVKKSGLKPCIEAILIRRYVPEDSFSTIKYLKVLVQDFCIRIDQGFQQSVYDIFWPSTAEESEAVKLRADLTTIYTPLISSADRHIPKRQEKAIIEYLHLSPLKIHFSYSPRGTAYKVNPDPPSLKGDIFKFFVNSLGASLTEVKDIELKLAYYEKRGCALSSTQLLTDIQSHYYSQFVQQSYVLILGLDILGNPFGLVKDFTQGFGDFFYEPCMASLRGPDEYAESISRGAHSLLGHVVGGTSGSVSLITGSLGHALSVLSFDEDYRKKRHQRMQIQGTLPTTVVAASKSFIMGVALGLSGVIVKPYQDGHHIAGSQMEGVEGFFKGIGKGLMGLLTKPAGGVIDSVSMATDGIRRAVEMGEDVVMRSRMPRFLNPHQGVKPFSPYVALGYQLLLNLCKGHYAESDLYFAHAALKKQDRSDVALITDNHLFLLEKCRFWGGWEIQWMVEIDEIMSVPTISGNKLVIKITKDEKLNVLSGDERHIPCDDIEVLKWLQTKIEKVLILNMKDKPCAINQ